MARIQASFVTIGVVLALLLAMLPSVGLAQTSSEIFAEAVAAQAATEALAGPNALDLEQSAGVLTVYKAGLDTANFVAHAVFVNPEVVDGVGWDYGFQFRTTGNNEDFRVFVTSDGTWNFSIGTATPSQSAVAPGFDVTPGVANSLDLVVEGSEALFGVNGQFAGTVQLPEQPATGDIYASTGFLGSLVSEGRIVPLSEFTVYPLPGEEATPEPATPEAEQPALPARPVQLVSGTCDEPGDLVFDLLEATYPVGERVGAATGIVAETSFTRVPLLLGNILAAPHAIVVGESFDAPDDTIACADIGGIPDELGGFVIGLAPQNAAGYAGTIFMAADDANGTTNVSVFLIPVDIEAVVDLEEADAASGADDTAQGDEVEAAPPEASPVAEIEDIVAEAVSENTVIEIEAGATPEA